MPGSYFVTRHPERTDSVIIIILRTVSGGCFIGSHFFCSNRLLSGGFVHNPVNIRAVSEEKHRFFLTSSAAR